MLATLLAAATISPAAAQPPPAAATPLPVPLAAANPAAARAPLPTTRRPLRFEAGTGGVVTLPSAAANVFVADPRIAEVRPASANTLFIFGVGAGRTTVAAVDAAGASVAEYDVFVRPAAYASAEAQATIARVMPGSQIRVSPQSKGLLLSGQVANPEEAARALSIARGFITDGQSIEDQITVAANVQVMLRVRIAEVSRSVTRNLGIDWQALGNIGSIANLTALTLSANGLTNAACTVLNPRACQGASFSGILDALAQDNLARILAEPNLTVMSGQQGSFLAGGEFPIPVGQQNGTISIEFKKFGVSLGFQPTVLSEDRIQMKVSPEVSQISRDVQIELIGSGRSLLIPGLSVRRAETTLELGSGQSFAIAGLLQDTVTQGDKAIPGIGEVPILGSLFRSDKFLRQETELVILITPYIVRPVNNPSQLRVAGENYTVPNDRDRLLHLRQIGRAAAPTATGRAAAGPASASTGRPGFILQ
ncbi:MAG: type II and III secretion system protein family protein [Acetobacteraceae bacterium]|nr:type II and III secretion system protein family protein [Acetobacteraceae bacterium]